jgi:hypothetical protein
MRVGGGATLVSLATRMPPSSCNYHDVVSFVSARRFKGVFAVGRTSSSYALCRVAAAEAAVVAVVDATMTAPAALALTVPAQCRAFVHVDVEPVLDELRHCLRRDWDWVVVGDERTYPQQTRQTTYSRRTRHATSRARTHAHTRTQHNNRHHNNHNCTRTPRS